jgi:uncharacterized repeat protein (TIGR04076 family)
MEDDRDLDLHIDLSVLKTHDDYKKLWERMGKIEIKMVEQREECQHRLGDTFVYENPYKKPAGVCNALLHVLDLYTWRIAFGFPSWDSAHWKVHRIHCPDAKGTVWEIKKID